MFLNETFESVVEMAPDLEGDPSFADDLERHLAERRLIKRFIALRCAQGLSQQAIADKMGCTQGRISKLEASRDDDLRFGDIRAYAGALGLTSILGLERGPNAVARVRFHAACIRKQVDSLARLATNDPEIAKAVSGLFSEPAFNLLKTLELAAKPSLPDVAAQIVGPDGEDGDEVPPVAPKRKLRAKPVRS